jgi:hypothetical protein
MKFRWCLGWVQALHERIAEVQIYARLEDMKAKKEARATRSYEGPDKDYSSICLPADNRVPDLIRAIVKGLSENPTQLHEPKNGPVKAALKKPIHVQRRWEQGKRLAGNTREMGGQGLSPILISREGSETIRLGLGRAMQRPLRRALVYSATHLMEGK